MILHQLIDKHLIQKEIQYQLHLLQLFIMPKDKHVQTFTL